MKPFRIIVILTILLGLHGHAWAELCITEQDTNDFYSWVKTRIESGPLNFLGEPDVRVESNQYFLEFPKADVEKNGEKRDYLIIPVGDTNVPFTEIIVMSNRYDYLEQLLGIELKQPPFPPPVHNCDGSNPEDSLIKNQQGPPAGLSKWSWCFLPMALLPLLILVVWMRRWL